MDLGDVLAMVRAEPSERDKRRWRLLKALLSERPVYAPWSHPYAADGSLAVSPAIVGHLLGMSPEQRATALQVPEDAKAFGGWRAAVTALEAKNAGRLEVLVGHVLFAVGLLSHARDTAPIHAVLGQLSERMEPWNVRIPEGVDVRRWPASVTRRYDLLPRELRWLPRQELDT